MKRAMKFKLDVVIAMHDAMAREVTRAESELMTFRPEDFKDPKLQKDFMELALAVAEAKTMVRHYSEAKELMEKLPADFDPDKPEEKQEKASIGFTAKLKEAA
jgi:hypothetical protein